MTTTGTHPLEVRWEDVGKIYPDGQEALKGVSLAVEGSQILALLGGSGSGKTTLLKLVNRLVDPSSGRVVVGGRSTADWDPVTLRRSIGYVIQEVGLLPHFNVLENVGIVPRLLGVPKSEREARGRELLLLVGLDPDRHASRRPRELSGGQRQRVGVARALAADPGLILMDEPFGALDPLTRRELQAEFLDWQRRLGMTVVLVTHDVNEALRLGDRLALLDRGRLTQFGTPDEVLDHPADATVRSFFEGAGEGRP